MSVPMKAVKPLKYKTRRFLPGADFSVKSESEAKVLVHLKRAVRRNNMNANVALDDARESVGLPPLSKESEDIKVWRDKYQEANGKRPFYGWSIAELKEKIAE